MWRAERGGCEEVGARGWERRGGEEGGAVAWMPATMINSFVSGGNFRSQIYKWICFLVSTKPFHLEIGLPYACAIRIMTSTK